MQNSNWKVRSLGQILWNNKGENGKNLGSGLLLSTVKTELVVSQIVSRIPSKNHVSINIPGSKEDHSQVHRISAFIISYIIHILAQCPYFIHFGRFQQPQFRQFSIDLKQFF